MTSGNATERETCLAETPATVSELLSQLESGAVVTVYREDVFHPALPSVQSSHGTLKYEADGTLVRRQEAPAQETVRIGENFLTVVDSQGAENMLPIPDQVAPVLGALRGLLSGNIETGLQGFSVVIEAPGPPWQVRITSENLSDTSLLLHGCGSQVIALEMQMPDLVRRLMTFDPVN